MSQGLFFDDEEASTALLEAPGAALCEAQAYTSYCTRPGGLNDALNEAPNEEPNVLRNDATNS